MKHILVSLWNEILRNWGGIVVGLAGIAVAIHLRHRPRISLHIDTVRLISRHDTQLASSITILFDKQPVEHVLRTHVWIWNSGNTTFRGMDVVDDDPLRFVLKEGSLLSAQVVRTTRKTNKMRVSTNRFPSSDACIEFDYLDPGDGGVVELIHTSVMEEPHLLGTIRGLRQGLRRPTRLATMMRNIALAATSVALLALSIQFDHIRADSIAAEYEASTDVGAVRILQYEVRIAELENRKHALPLTLLREKERLFTVGSTRQADVILKNAIVKQRQTEEKARRCQWMQSAGYAALFGAMLAVFLIRFRLRPYPRNLFLVPGNHPLETTEH